jgi:hypothetical protein
MIFEGPYNESAMNTLINQAGTTKIETPKIKVELKIEVINSPDWAQLIMTQFIAKGYIENGDSAVLWRIADYHYQLEVGFGTPRQRSTDLTDTEYYDAFCMLQAICVKEVVATYPC